MRFVALLVVAVLAAETSVIACPAMAVTDRVATPDDADVYADGGVIVTVEHGRGGDHANELVADGKKLVGGKYIASGLSVVAPPPGATEIEINAGGSTVRRLAVVAAPAVLSAPKMKAVTSNATKPKPSRLAPMRAIPSTTTTITLAGPPPDDAFALVAYDRRGPDAMPRGWATVQQGVTTFTFVTGGKPCGRAMASPTFTGDHLRFVWLDRGGRLSKSTTMMRVGKTR